MRIIDKKGMLFGKINIIDALVVIFLLGAIPMVWYGFILYDRPKPIPPAPIHYKMSYPCPNCKKAIPVKIPHGESIPCDISKHLVDSETENVGDDIICSHCKNKVLLNKCIIVGKEEEKLVDHYKISWPCPNCKGVIDIKYPNGQVIPKNHAVICPICKNKVIVNREEPIIESDLTHEEQYYKYKNSILKNEYKHLLED